MKISNEPFLSSMCDTLCAYPARSLSRESIWRNAQIVALVCLWRAENQRLILVDFKMNLDQQKLFWLLCFCLRQLTIGKLVT